MKSCLLFLLLLNMLSGYAQVEIFRNTEDTATYIAPADTITRPPQFETGEIDFFNYLEFRFNRRTSGQAMDLNGAVVKFSFYVDKDGRVSDYKHLFASNAVVASEIERVVTNMPKWSPGYEHGKKKRTLMVYELNVRPVANTIPMVEITKNSGSAEYTTQTNPIKWFIVAGTILVLATLWIIK
jgi:hypothetical protein